MSELPEENQAEESQANVPAGTKLGQGGEPKQRPEAVVAEANAEVLHELHRRTRRSFLVAGAAAVAGYGFWRWAGHGDLDGLPRPLRKAERFNESVSRDVLGDKGLAPTYAPARAVRQMRLNGDIGLDTDLVPASWRLGVIGLARPGGYPQSVRDVSAWQYESDPDGDMDEAPDNSTNGSGGIPQTPPGNTGGTDTKQAGKTGDVKGGSGPIDIGTTTVAVSGDTNSGSASGAHPGVLLTLADLRTLPHVEQTTEFKCIEGWSQVVRWGGVRFADFVKRYEPQRNAKGRLPRYVALETPNGDYYVGLYMSDALHPQTLLCYEINGQPLSMEHGAPLRLVIPLKYGIKHLKQIGRITFTDRRPRDYWAEQGYDWYSGH